MRAAKLKKNVLVTTGIVGGMLFFLLLGLIYDFCGPYRQICKYLYTPIAYLCFSFPVLFFLSLITYCMRDEVFQAWWNFARWWVPVIVIVTILLEIMSSGGGSLGMDATFDALIYTILYGTLIIVSLVKIFRAWSKKVSG